MRPALPPLLLGLALGATAGWFAPRLWHATTAQAPDTSPHAPGSVALPAWSWRDAPAPPTLAPDAIGPAIAAWRGLRAADGSPASYAARADALRVLLARLPAEAFPRLLDTLAAAETDADRRLRGIAFDAWTETDAPAAARWAAAAGPDLRGLARKAVEAWAALDAPAASAWACALRDPEAARELASLALAALAATDPARALALAGSRDDAFEKAVFPALFENLAKADPAAALRAHGSVIWANGDGFWKLNDTLRAWAKKDPEAAIAWIIAQPCPHQGMMSNWLADLAQTPEESLRLAAIIADNPAIPERDEALGWMLQRFSERDAAPVIAWLDAHASPELRAATLRHLGGSYPTGHPEVALPYALARSPSQNRTQSLSRLLESWTQADPAAALAWLGQQTDPGVIAAGAKVQATLLADIARSEPRTAVAEWEALADPLAKKVAVGAIAREWGATDPAAALQWAAAQQLDPGSNRVPVQLLTPWAQKDPEAALRWAESYVAGLPDEQQRWYSSHVMSLLGGQGDTKVPRAQTADLYLKIQDAKLRSQTLAAHTSDWLANDPAAARAWLESHRAALPESVVNLLKHTR